MSLIFCDGFDDGQYATKWTAVGSQNYTTGRNGQAMQLFQGNGGMLKKVVAAADEHATFISGHAYRSSAGTTDNSAWQQGGAVYGSICSFLSDAGATCHVSFGMSFPNVLFITRGLINSGNTLATYTMPTISYSDWYYFEAKATLHDTTGSAELKINGVTVMQVTNVDTKNAGTKTVFDGVGVGTNQVANGVHNLCDDFYLCNGAGSVNNNFLGDIAIETVYPNADGTFSQFLGSDGNSTNNYLLVDETPPNTTDYVGGANVGDKDLYGMANLTRTSGSVRGVMVSGYVQNSDAGARGAGLIVKSGATTTSPTDTALSTTWSGLSKMMEVDPNTSAAWTVANVNALEAGIQVTS